MGLGFQMVGQGPEKERQVVGNKEMYRKGVEYEARGSNTGGREGGEGMGNGRNTHASRWGTGKKEGKMRELTNNWRIQCS